MPRRSRRPRFIDPFQPTHIRRLVKEFGSPLLILDSERVRVQFRKLRKALPGVDLHYALKPLPHPAVVQTVIHEGAFSTSPLPERCSSCSGSGSGPTAASTRIRSSG